MARYKLVEYLNDPSLLLSTSIEELNSWAEEAPYSGLIRRLIAQKLAIENTSEVVIEKANTIAILSNANPEYTISSIEDFKKLILGKESQLSGSEMIGSFASEFKEKIEKTEKLNDLHEVEESSYTEDVPQTISPGEITEEIIEFVTPNKTKISDVPEQEILSEVSQEQGDKEEPIDGFFTWLSSLKSLEEADGKNQNLELEDKELASEGLAELLVRQGHYKSAIDMYELLKLKIPEKSSFFAAQIETLKAL